MGLNGAFLALIVSALLLVFICFPLLLKRFTFQFSKKVIRILIRYGLPFVLSSFSLTMLFQMDQVILKFLISLEAVAIYGMSYKIGSAIQYFNSSFSITWFPYLFEQKEKKAKELIPYAFKYYLTIILVIATFSTILNNYFLNYILPDNYKIAVKIIPWIIWGYLVFGLSDFLGAGLFFKYKSQRFSVISTIAAVFNIIFNIIFIKLYGIYAAAIITFASFVLLTIISFQQSSKIFPVKFPFLSYLKISAVFLLILMASFYHPGFDLEIVYAIFLMIFTVICPFIFRFFKFSQFKSLFLPQSFLK